MNSTLNTAVSTQNQSPRYEINHYPAELIDTRRVHTASGQHRLTLRPVLPQDGRLLADLVAGLSPLSRRHRFHGAVRLSAQRLAQMACVDFERELAVVVTSHVNGAERVIADARYHLNPNTGVAEFAVMVDEAWRRMGIGSWTLQALQSAAAAAGLQGLVGQVLLDNQPMLGLMNACAFALRPDPEDERVVQAHSQWSGLGSADTAPRHRPGMLGWLARQLMRRAAVCTRAPSFTTTPTTTPAPALSH